MSESMRGAGFLRIYPRDRRCPECRKTMTRIFTGHGASGYALECGNPECPVIEVRYLFGHKSSVYIKRKVIYDSTMKRLKKGSDG